MDAYAHEIIKGFTTFVPIHDRAHTTEPTHVCAHTRSCLDMFVPRHICAQTRLCPDTFVPRLICTQTHLICAQT